MGKNETVAPASNELSNINVGVIDNKSFDVESAAKDVLENGDPITYILDVFNKIHIGDRRIGELLALSVGTTCIANCAGIHPKLSGESGKGKSHSGKAMLHLLPKKYVLHTSLSGKALFYHKIDPGMIVFSDDVRLSEDLETLIKQATGDFQLGIEHMTVDVNRSGKTLTIPPRIVWWLASVDDELDEQTLNRQVGVGVDCSSETDELVFKHQLDLALTGESEFPENNGVSVCREIYRIIKEMFVRVVIPFADRIEWHGVGNRRNAPIFLDMIKTYALFSYRQRATEIPSDESLPIIFASEQDYEMAESLYADRAETQTTKLTNDELDIVRFLVSYGSADVNKISASVGLTYQKTRRLLVGRKDGNGGMLGKVTGLSVDDVIREIDEGEKRRICEYSISGFDLLASYGGIVQLRDIKER